MRETSEPRSVGPAACSRREFLARGVAGFGALAWPHGPAVPPRRTPRAEGVIQIFLHGGLSQLDSFDPKPEAPVEVRGAFRAIETRLPGVRFSELCAQTASIADRLVVLRAMTHTEAAHERGVANMLTGYRPSPAISYPSFGAVLSHELGGRNDLPPHVCIPGVIVPELGTGYLGSAHGPFSVGGEPASKDFAVRDLSPRADLGAARAERRRALLDALDGGFAAHASAAASADAVAATQAFYARAWQMLASDSARLAFRIELESAALRDRYGRSEIGQRLLLARRLVEAGVRYVAVHSTGWDHHQRLADSLRRQLPDVDRGFAALIGDLDERGLLDRTLVLLTTEFGRTPRTNADAGRDHWPRVFSVLAAGGGLVRGTVIGASDAAGAEPEERPVRPADLAATLFTLCGIDPAKRLMSPGDRPIDIVRDGALIAEIVT